MSQEDPKNHQEKTSDSLYLEQLQFEPEKANPLLNFLLTNVRVIFLIIISIMAWGVYSFLQLPLESNPEVEIPFGIVSVALPGASPADVEELVIKKIESKIVNLTGVKQVTSTASNSFAAISVEFRAEEDLKDSIRRLRDAVETVKNDLPAEANDPIVSEVSFSNSPVWTLVLTGPYDNFTLRKYADLVKDEFLKMPGTSDVNISGGDISEIKISYLPQKLQQYGLSMDQVNAAIRGNNLTLPLGEINVGNFEYGMRLDGKFKNIQELRHLPIASVGGGIVVLSDVANVVERAAERKTLTRFSIAGQEPQNAISLSVVKKTGYSIIDLIDSGKVRLEELKKNSFPDNLEFATTLDLSERIREDFYGLAREGLFTMVLVSIMLFLFVGLKEAFTAGIVIPLVFATTFGLMVIFDMTLNFLSLFSLILSLGLLVDDAIVVVQATKQYMATGKFTPEEAVLLVFKDFFAIIMTTSLTTIFAFLPLVLASGIIGQFIRSIPITVSLTIAASTIIAIAINHPMAAILERFHFTRSTFRVILAVLILLLLLSLKSAFSGTIMAIVLCAVLTIAILALIIFYRNSWKEKLLQNEQLILEEKAFPEKIKEKLRHHYSDTPDKTLSSRLFTGIVKMDRILPTYARFLSRFLESKLQSFILLLIVFLIFLGSVALPATGVLKSEFLPPSDQVLMYVNIQGAPGLSLEETKKVADQVEKILRQEKQIKNFSVIVGSIGYDASGGGASTSGGTGSSGQTNRAQFTINLWPAEERPVDQKSYVYAAELRKKLTTVQGANITLQEIAGGPPSGSDFEVRFTGEDLVRLEELANNYKEILSAIPGTINEKTSLTLSPGEFTFKLKPDAMSLRGLTPAQVASSLRTAISGAEITKIIQGEDEYIVRAEYEPSTVSTIEGIKSLTFSTPQGQNFQLSEVADVSLGASLTSIRRINEKRVIILSAGVEAPHLPGEVLAAFQKKLAENPLPNGYQAIFGGQNDTNAESIYSILRAMIIAFLLIIGTLVIQFNSFLKAILVLFTIPLALTGVFYGLTLIGFTLSFPTLIGILALFGIVVKNAIILVDKINLNLRVGIPFQSAILDASKSRLEAIFLTSVATVIGMIPLTLFNQTWEGLGAALIFGLSTSTILTLIVIPVLFNLLFAKSAARDAKLREMQAQGQINPIVHN